MRVVLQIDGDFARGGSPFGTTYDERVLVELQGTLEEILYTLHERYIQPADIALYSADVDGTVDRDLVGFRQKLRAYYVSRRR